MIGELKVRSFATNLAVLGIDNDIAVELPDAIFEIELARQPLVSLDSDRALAQPQPLELRQPNIRYQPD